MPFAIPKRAALMSAKCQTQTSIAQLHSITSSAVANSVCSLIRPGALAVVRLMIRSNLTGCKTGNSAGFDPPENPPSVGDGLPIILAPSEILSSLDRLGGGWVDPVFEEEAQHFPRGVRSSPISE